MIKLTIESFSGNRDEQKSSDEYKIGVIVLEWGFENTIGDI